MPGASGGAPHTVGPLLIAGMTRASSSKYDRSTSKALARLHCSSRAPPLPRRASTAASIRGVEAGPVPISRLSSATGRASAR